MTEKCGKNGLKVKKKSGVKNFQFSSIFTPLFRHFYSTFAPLLLHFCSTFTPLLLHFFRQLEWALTGWGKSSLTDRLNLLTTLIQGLEKTHFWTSFSAFPKKVVMNKFVARELPGKTHFSDFAGTKFFSLTLTIFRFRFNKQFLWGVLYRGVLYRGLTVI